MYSNPRGENSQGPRRAANILRGGSKEQTPGPRAETNPYGSDPRVSHRPSKSVRFATVDAPVAPEETNQEVHPRGGVLSTVVNITSDTPLPAVVRYLATHSSIADLTDELSHFPAVSMHPVTSTALSDIYRATRSDGTRLAIKCLRQSDPKHAKHTARELNTWSKLKHPNILELHGGAVFQGCLAMVSPWMPYGGVRSMIQKWPNTDRYKLCYQLASAVQYLHEENVVHGDIKGDNLLVAEDGTLKVTDFGLTILHDKVFQFSQTDPAGGTCRWMAPELYVEGGRRSLETDVYAMGMTMLEIITGDIPFAEIESGHMVIAAILMNRRIPQVPVLQKAPVSPQAAIMLGVLRWCWEYDSNKRPTAQQVTSLMNGLCVAKRREN